MNPPQDNFAKWLEEDSQSFWLFFRDTQDLEMRNFLIETYLHLVKYHAERLGAKLHDKLDLEDLKQVGVLGLIHAIEHYDPTREVQFSTYCSQRIRGSILDDLRSQDWVPRTVRKQYKRVQKAYQELEEELGRLPDDGEMAEHMGLSIEEYEEVSKEASATSILPLSGKDDKGEPLGLESFSDKKALNPEREVEKKDLIQTMLGELDTDDKKLLYLYYYKNCTMGEIGKVLNVCESRVSQRHSSLLNRLKFRYGDDIADLAA